MYLTNKAFLFIYVDIFYEIQIYITLLPLKNSILTVVAIPCIATVITIIIINITFIKLQI